MLIHLLLIILGLLLAFFGYSLRKFFYPFAAFFCFAAVVYLITGYLGLKLTGENETAKYILVIDNPQTVIAFFVGSISFFLAIKYEGLGRVSLAFLAGAIIATTLLNNGWFLPTDSTGQALVSELVKSGISIKPLVLPYSIEGSTLSIITLTSVGFFVGGLLLAIISIFFDRAGTILAASLLGAGLSAFGFQEFIILTVAFVCGIISHTIILNLHRKPARAKHSQTTMLNTVYRDKQNI